MFWSLADSLLELVVLLGWIDEDTAPHLASRWVHL